MFSSWWWAVVPPIIIGLVLANANLDDFRGLSRNGVRTDAIVGATGCDDGRFAFTFNVDGREWGGTGQAWRAGVDCASLVPGARVAVYYEPANPARHVATVDPAALVRQESLIVMGFTLAAFAGGVLVVWRERRKAAAGVR